MNFETNYNVSDFVYFEKQIEDVLRIVDTITPVLSLMRDYYNTSKQLEETGVEIERANGKIQAYLDILTLKPNKKIKFAIEVEIVRVREYGLKCFSLQLELIETLTDLKGVIDEYFKYMHSFDWLHFNLLIEVLSRLPEENKAKFVATILLFINNSVKEEERSEILNYLCGDNEFVTDVEIKHALISLQCNDNAFIQYISERDFE